MNDTDYFFEGYEDLEISTQIIIRDALDRGISVEILDRHHNFIRLTRGDKIEYVKEATKTSKDTYISPLIMENKAVSKLVLQERGLVVPLGKSFSHKEDAFEYCRSVRGEKTVIKPSTTNFGIGISIVDGETEWEVVEAAVHSAFTHSETIIVETFISGGEYRFLVVDSKIIAVCKRVPANVTGDGVRTITALVTEKNKDPRRGEGHITPLEKIQLGNIEKQLLEKRGYTVDTVPGKGETVFLRTNSNVSTGGDSVDVTDTAHPFYREIAIKGADAAGAKICGVDIIIPDHTAKGDYAILELNFNPVLYIHNYPYEGKNRRVGEKILEFLGFDNQVNDISQVAE
jgi:glutamate--cysteine ligase/glutathione synthase